MEKEDEKGMSEEQLKELSKKQSKTLRNIIIVGTIIIFSFLLTLFVIGKMKQFDYYGLTFEKIKEGNINFFHTTLPVFLPTTGKFIGDYNIYIRNDPRDLEKIVNMSGDINMYHDAVLNSTSELNCNGDGIIAVANMVNILKAFEVTTIKDPTANCNPDMAYTYIEIRESNETSIEQFGPACYYINVNNCEVLPATERFLVETLVKINKNREN